MATLEAGQSDVIQEDLQNSKRKTMMEDLIDGVASLKIGWALTLSMKKLKLSHKDLTTGNPFPVPNHTLPPCLNSGKETVLKDASSTKPTPLQVPDAPVAVSSIQEDSLAPTFTGFLK